MLMSRGFFGAGAPVLRGEMVLLLARGGRANVLRGKMVMLIVCGDCLW